VQFEFVINDIGMPGDLDITIQNERNSGTGRRSSFLGKVTIPISTVTQRPDTIRWYPLQRRGLFSHIKGDLGWVPFHVLESFRFFLGAPWFWKAMGPIVPLGP
jgi:hypothetical protein